MGARRLTPADLQEMLLSTAKSTDAMDVKFTLRRADVPTR
jgi:hypothetical protein